jgi:anti-anti-sigma factor
VKGRTIALPPDPSESQPFRCEIEPSRDGVRVCPVGELDMATVPTVAAQLQALRAADVDRLVLDLSDVEFADSCALRLMLAWTELAEREGFVFSLVDGPPPVQRLFEITQVRAVLNFVHASAPTRMPGPRAGS